MVKQWVLIIFSVLFTCLSLGCASKAQDDVEDLTVAVSECMWNEAHAEDSTGIANEWLKDKALMDFLHASNLGSENLLQEAAKSEVSGYATAGELQASLISVVNNGYADEVPEPSFLEYVARPSNRDQQGHLIVLYLHLFHCREHWQGTTATEVLKHDDDLSDLAECYWQKFRVEKLPLPKPASNYMLIASLTDYVSASQVDGVFRSTVHRFKGMTPEKMADTIKSKSSLCS